VVSYDVQVNPIRRGLDRVDVRFLVQDALSSGIDFGHSLLGLGQFPSVAIGLCFESFDLAPVVFLQRCGTRRGGHEMRRSEKVRS
jgi:hypothetical protein